MDSLQISPSCLFWVFERGIVGHRPVQRAYAVGLSEAWRLQQRHLTLATSISQCRNTRPSLWYPRIRTVWSMARGQYVTTLDASSHLDVLSEVGPIARTSLETWKNMFNSTSIFRYWTLIQRLYSIFHKATLALQFEPAFGWFEKVVKAGRLAEDAVQSAGLASCVLKPTLLVQTNQRC